MSTSAAITGWPETSALGADPSPGSPLWGWERETRTGIPGGGPRVASQVRYVSGSFPPLTAGTFVLNLGIPTPLAQVLGRS